MVDMGVQTSLVSDLPTEASRLAQQGVVTKNVEEDVVKNGKALVGFPLPAVKGTRSRSIRRSCGPYGRCLAMRPSGRESQGRKEEWEKRVGPEGEDEKGGEGAQRRACEKLEGRMLGAFPMHEAVDDEVGQVRLGENEGRILTMRLQGGQ